MILTCTCGAKLKLSDDKLTEAGVKIKCPKCGTAHIARKPALPGAEPFREPAMPWFAPASSVDPSSAVPPEKPAAARSSAPANAPRALSADVPSQASFRAPALVLVAHDSIVVAEMIQSVLKDAGLAVEHATDGLEALRMATELKPQAMIVDVGLTGIYGFELCERLKSDPDTRGIKIILLSSVYGLTAYKRNPITLYGADDYIEKHHIPDRLVPKLMQLLSGQTAAAPQAPPSGLVPAGAASPVTSGTAAEKTERPPESPVPVAPAAMAGRAELGVAASEVPDVMPKVPVTLDVSRKRPVAAAPTVTIPRSAPPVAAAPGPATPDIKRTPLQDESIKLDASFFEQEEYEAPAESPSPAVADSEEVEKARRFARLVVSDIVLYNQEAVAEGIVKGTFYELLTDDITEGRALYDKRVPESIRANKDYFQEAFDNFIATKKKQR